jgi:deazaflavin-dependent oxidoreductase (nitroreductase family)
VSRPAGGALRFLPENRMAKDFVKALKTRRQISITVTGRRTGRAITIPVWFVSDDRALWLLPVYGSDTQWYRNLEKNRGVTIRAGAKRLDLCARLRKDARSVSTVIRRFREKYTPGEIKLCGTPGSMLRCRFPCSLRERELRGVGELTPS